MIIRTIALCLSLALLPAAVSAQDAQTQAPVQAPSAQPTLPVQPAPEPGVTSAATATPAAPAPYDASQPVLAIELSSGGTVKILMRPDKAPNHVARIQQLVREGFYTGTPFHRVIPGFMAQGGDPTGTGQGGSKLPDLKAEFNDLMHFRGVASMARAQSVDSANSQFFIMLMPNFDLDGKYTVWGRVFQGMDAVDRIAKGEPPAQPTTIVRAWLETSPPMAVAAATPPKQ